VTSAVSLRYGPDATPFVVDADGIAVDDKGRRPFHGIVSRGLLVRAGAVEGALPRWSDHAHRLAEESVGQDDGPDRAWSRAAAQCGLLSFAQSTACARLFAQQIAVELGFGAATGIALWNVREGHTSSVWHVRIDGAADALAVNVARDRIAGEELRRTSQVLKQIGDAWPEANIARVHAIAEVQPAGLAEPVVVTRNEWVAEADEIHRLPDGRLIVVDRFIADDDAPADIRRIRGRRLGESECAQVDRDIAAFMARGAEHAVQLDINEGDLVWDGRRAVVVAIR
jgi:hypothetical protein